MTITFDFEGSLALARRLWAVADELSTVLAARRGLADGALIDWTGAYADAFVGRTDSEQLDGSRLAETLRAEAGGWAEEWRRAMDQENWNRYAAAVDRVESKRGVLDTVGGFLFGHDDLPGTPAAADLPRPPTFAATRSFANYSHH